jgi:protein-S-isoprenylcysteine O-methyltransferase Ste14
MTMSPLLAIPGLAIMAAVLAVVVVAGGGPAAFFAESARTAFAVVYCLLVLAALASCGNLSAGVREDRRNRWVLPALGVIGVLLAIVPPWMDRIGFWSLDGGAVRWMGVALFAAGGMLRLWPVFVLGNRFSGLVAIQPGHALVTTGLYRVIRHPSYLGLLVTSLGWALVFRAALGLVLVALTIWPLRARIRAEEALLEAHFGDEYQAYRLRTWRLLPGVY